MEEWNIGMLDKKLNHQNPLFHHSIIPIVCNSSIPIYLLRVLSGSILFFIPGGYGDL
jgi:hypothetical protein